MSGFIKKALGMFVEIDDNTPSHDTTENRATPTFTGPPRLTPTAQAAPVYNTSLSQQDIDKFTKHFDDLFDKSNFPGPDYYEFSKMMHLLEPQIPDESIRVATVFASLSIQGLTKDKILATAQQYLTIIDNDKAQFEKAASDKAAVDVEGRKNTVADLEKKINDNADMIRKLTQEITELQSQIGTLKNEIVQEDTKISANKGSFQVAYQAMYNKISGDIQKINTILK